MSTDLTAVSGAAGAVAPFQIARPIPCADATPQITYARFGQRVGAFFIDAIIIQMVLMVVNMLFVTVLLSGINTQTILITAFGPLVLGGAFATFYSVWLESSSWQATPGKRALGLKVVDMQGRRITFCRSCSRSFGKTLSALLLGVGYLMPLWTAKKQALHDKMAGCLVVQTRC